MEVYDELEKALKEIERLKEDNEYLNKVNIELSTLNTSLRSDRDNYKYIINKGIEILDIYGTSNYETADLLYSVLRGSDKE